MTRRGIKRTHEEPSNFQPGDLKKKLRRQRRKLHGMICFLCRQRGHSIKDCPENNQAELCYRCGSFDHSLAQCMSKKQGLEFAYCFNCKQNGHLVGQCPKNEHGLYPNGGSCRFCGSVRHLARDCKPTDQTEIGLIDMEQGGDDDDVFVAVHKMNKEKAIAGKLQDNGLHSQTSQECKRVVTF